MSNKQTVLVLGATGGAGSDVIDGLLEDGSFVRRLKRIRVYANPAEELLTATECPSLHQDNIGK